MRAELARATKFEGQVAGPDDGDALVAGPGLDETAQGAAQLDEPPGLRKRRGEDVRVDRHDGQICLWRVVMMGQVMLWSTRSSLLNAKSKPASSPARRRYAESSSCPFSTMRGSPNSRSSL